MWSHLTPTERDKFLKALNDPSSELAQQLLTSEELETQIVDPWWDQPSDYGEERPQPVIDASGARKIRRYGHKPKFLDVPTSAIKASENVGTTGPSLLYNICAVLYVSVKLHICF